MQLHIVQAFTYRGRCQYCPFAWSAIRSYCNTTILWFQNWRGVHIQVWHPIDTVVNRMTWFITNVNYSRRCPRKRYSFRKRAVQVEAWPWTAVCGVTWKHLLYTNACKLVNKLSITLGLRSEAEWLVPNKYWIWCMCVCVHSQRNGSPTDSPTPVPQMNANSMSLHSKRKYREQNDDQVRALQYCKIWCVNLLKNHHDANVRKQVLLKIILVDCRMQSSTTSLHSTLACKYGNTWPVPQIWF